MTGAQAIATMLKTQGAELLFTYPDQLVLEAAAVLGIRPIMPRSERAAVAMADGFARVSNGTRLSTVAVQYGPGIESSFGGVAQAYSDSSPILILCGHTPLARLGQEPNFDPVANFRGITKWTARPETSARIPETFRRAFTMLQTGRPGPVLIDLPLEAVVGECDSGLVESFTRVPRWRSAADPRDISAAVALLLASRRAVIHAGQGTLYAEASEELQEFAELGSIPVMTTLPGKSAFPEDHPLALGAAGLSWPRTVSEFVEQSDLVIAVGSSLTASQFAFPIPEGKKVVQIVLDERDLNKDYPVAVALVGDAKLVLGQLIQELKDELNERSVVAGYQHVSDEIAAVRSAEKDEWSARFASDEIPISPYRVLAEVARATAGMETIVTAESGRPRDQVVPFWVSRLPRSYLGWGKSTQLGHSLGLIMGAKLAAPNKVAITFMGDAAIGMTGMELESASRLGIPVITIVFNNGGMSRYERRYPVAHGKYGFKKLTGSYQAVARALGCQAEYVENPAQLSGALARALKAAEMGQPVLLEVVTKEEGAISQPRLQNFVPRWAAAHVGGELIDTRA